MEIEIDRKKYTSTSTIGDLYVDAKWECNTLEDAFRDVKIQDKTCIPAGTYQVILSYSNRFKQIMPEILNVPNFMGIRIHPGNTSEDTAGCILVGSNTRPNELTGSRFAYTELMKKLNAKKEPITITIKNYNHAKKTMVINCEDV